MINSKTLCWEGIFHCSSRYDILPWIQLRWFSKPKLHLLSMPYSELKSILQNWFHSSIWIVCPSITINLVRKGRQDFAPCCFFLKFGQEKLIFSYCSKLHKQPKQKKSCSKMTLIDQLFIKLGMAPLFFRASHVAVQRFAIFCSKMHCCNKDMLVSSWGLSWEMFRNCTLRLK